MMMIRRLACCPGVAPSLTHSVMVVGVMMAGAMQSGRLSSPALCNVGRAALQVDVNSFTFLLRPPLSSHHCFVFSTGLE